MWKWCHLSKGVFMVNVWGLDFGSPIPFSMIVLEIFLLCDWQALLLTKCWDSVEPPSPPAPRTWEQEQCSTLTSRGWRNNCIHVKSSMNGRLFFSNYFWSYIFWFIYIMYNYLCLYMQLYTSPSFGSWRVLHAFFAKEVIKWCPQNIYNYKNVPVKVLKRKYDSLKAL